MLTISSNAIIEKNKITSSGTWLLLLEIIYPGESSIRICLNNENVTWNSETWYPAVFNLTGISETKDAELPSINLVIFDLNRSIIPYLEAYDGGIGSEVILRVVHSDNLAETTPELEESTEIIDVSVDHQARINFKLGAENLADRRCPQQRYLKNNCRFIFKKAEINFTSGGTGEIIADQYIQGDTSGHQAKVIEVRLTSGSWAGGDAAGKIIIFTINGAFQSENISTYSDVGFTTLVQTNNATVSASTGRCGYTGAETSCNRSFARCLELNNDTRFGGFIGVGNSGFLK